MKYDLFSYFLQLGTIVSSIKPSFHNKGEITIIHTQRLFHLDIPVPFCTSAEV